MNIGEKVKRFINRSKMIFYKLTRPKPSEFKKTARITFIGMVLIGSIGLVIWLLFTVIRSLLSLLTGG